MEDTRMKLKRLPCHLTVCKVANKKDIDLAAEFNLIGKTDEQLSLVCRTFSLYSRNSKGGGVQKAGGSSCLMGSC